MTTGESEISYILPLRAQVSQAESDLTPYLAGLARLAEVIVVDASPVEVFRAHAAAWAPIVRHLPPDPTLATPMGKVGNVLTGLRHASHERIVIADDDVRYDAATLRRVAAALDDADVVRPQNYFSPMPWHAAWDTGRALLNRMSGGDWPGTLAVRRSALERSGGYDGRAMFENLELVRTVIATGGREAVLLDAYVERRPSTARHFWSQRVRQAYDELARPGRLFAQLAVLPAALLLASIGGAPAVAAAAITVAGVAEAGRRRAGGRAFFPPHASLLAPVWLAERGVCSWLAIGSRAIFGGVRYRGRVLRHAATPMRVLRQRHGPNRPAALAAQPPAPRRQSA